jgi:hypothetical protein
MNALNNVPNFCHSGRIQKHVAAIAEGIMRGNIDVSDPMTLRMRLLQADPLNQGWCSKGLAHEQTAPSPGHINTSTSRRHSHGHH